METLQGFIDQLIAGDDEQAEAAAARLPAYGPKAYDALVALAKDDDADTRWWALRAMAGLYDGRVASEMIPALGDPDPAVRACAARGLHDHPDARAIEPLLEAMNDPDSMVVRLAANALVAIGRPAVPIILEAFETAPDRVRMEIARLLALIGDMRAVPALFHALDDDSALIRHWVDDGLERMGIGMAFFKP